MTKRNEIYRCRICKNVVEITSAGEGVLVCCGENMEQEKENIPDIENAHYAFIEKISDIENRVFFKHVMTHEHHIEYIEAISNDGKFIKRKYLDKLEEASMNFKCNCENGFYIRLYCNLDGVWITKLER